VECVSETERSLLHWGVGSWREVAACQSVLGSCIDTPWISWIPWWRLLLPLQLAFLLEAHMDASYEEISLVLTRSFEYCVPTNTAANREMRILWKDTPCHGCQLSINATVHCNKKSSTCSSDHLRESWRNAIFSSTVPYDRDWHYLYLRKSSATLGVYSSRITYLKRTGWLRGREISSVVKEPASKYKRDYTWSCGGLNQTT